MAISITMVHFTVPILLPALRRRGEAGPATLAVEMCSDSVRIWDEEGHTACGEDYAFSPTRDWSTPLGEMPFLDEVFRYVASEYAANRANPLGGFLAPAVRALEDAVARRDGSSVYFAECDGRVKIGWSRKVASRIAQLQTGSSSAITLLGVVAGGRSLERRLHERFAACRVNGEWFDLTPELRSYIASAVGGAA